ncbi:hypothetical protein VRRI112168_19690 [Vreelandella rituensis]|uniref:hypothetical protein n=1 Tax=Vreelandella rituensis TaxID=2282306 RepID=UPI0015F0F6C2|nr:hypothetical protein [Halomonas rituensis]
MPWTRVKLNAFGGTEELELETVAEGYGLGYSWKWPGAAFVPDDRPTVPAC